MALSREAYLATCNERDRLAALADYDLMQTPPESDYDLITRFTAQLMHVPICLITIIGEHEQWLKSRWGLDVESTSRGVAFCATTIRSDHPLIVLDASIDPQFRKNPLVTGAPYIRFYAGAPLIGHDGVPLGALCLIDHKPRDSFTDEQQSMLVNIASIVAELFKHRRDHIITLRTERAAHLATANVRNELDAKTRSLEVVRTEVRAIVSDIAGLARTSSMLALNAKIEAERAGDLGKAFGAVAAEMKTLSVHTREATVRAEAMLGR